MYAKVLGMPQPALHRGTVIMSNMAVFELGPTGLGIAQPYAPGPAAYDTRITTLPKCFPLARYS